MSEIDYQEALKLGKKEYKTCVSEGRFPYLPVLDEILSHADIRTEQYIGLVQVPLEYVVGTSTVGRTVSFASNFMPILPPQSEFALKWAHLSDAQMNEGIRDPIIAYEYLNRYYVVEGNKRASVLKYVKAVSIPAIVTRKVPQYVKDDENIVRYYEFMRFNEATGLINIEFSRVGSADALLKMIGYKTPWSEQEKEEFGKVFFSFNQAYKFSGGDKLPINIGDALYAFMSVYGYEAMLTMNEKEYNNNITKAWGEFVMQTKKQNVDLVMDSKEVVPRQKRKHLLSYFFPSNSKKYTAAFLYPKSPDQSDWIYAHELGRNYLEETFSDKMRTFCVSDVREDNIEQVLNQVIKQGADIVFGIAPQMMKSSLKVAIENPKVKILNCSLNTPHKYIRTYYARMYEAKFISGMVAGAMTDNDRVAYIADYPIYGIIANINAFALGVASVNPRAKIYLDWSTRKGFNHDKFLTQHNLTYVSDQEMITPGQASRQFGVYHYKDGVETRLVMPLWNWGIFYEKMIQSILAGTYQNEDSDEAKALNYWWGMSSGVIDVICSKNVPAAVRRLAEHMKRDICSGDIKPFFGEIRAQDGTIKNKENEEMNPEDIMSMDWLAENVIGEIPQTDVLIEAAKSMVELKGVEKV